MGMGVFLGTARANEVAEKTYKRQNSAHDARWQNGMYDAQRYDSSKCFGHITVASGRGGSLHGFHRPACCFASGIFWGSLQTEKSLQ